MHPPTNPVSMLKGRGKVEGGGGGRRCVGGTEGGTRFNIPTTLWQSVFFFLLLPAKVKSSFKHVSHLYSDASFFFFKFHVG